MLTAILMSLGSLVLLAVAAEVFVEASGRTAVRLNVSPIVIGAVIVGFGTSAPEMLISGLAAGRGDVDLGVGNIIGSNTANITLVLGVAALITAVPVAREVVRREALAATFAVVVFAIFVQGGLNRIEGLVLVGLLVVMLGFTLRGQGDVIDVDPGDLAEKSLASDVFRIVGGLGATVAAAFVFVEGATRLASELGVSEGFVGLTLAALGTSAPELVTAAAAARQGQTELLIGNLLGSNIFNCFAVGGLVALLHPGALDDSSLVTIPVIAMLIAALGMFGFMLTGRKIRNVEGAIALLAYVASLPFLPR